MIATLRPAAEVLSTAILALQIAVEHDVLANVWIAHDRQEEILIGMGNRSADAHPCKTFIDPAGRELIFDTFKVSALREQGLAPAEIIRAAVDTQPRWVQRRYYA
jgi:hypothetical protein